MAKTKYKENVVDDEDQEMIDNEILEHDDEDDEIFQDCIDDSDQCDNLETIYDIIGDEEQEWN